MITVPRSPDLRHVVVGCGGLGAAAAYWLARAVGGRALVLERDTLGGDGQDPARVLRYAQHRDADAALAREAYATWRDVERVSGQTLVTETGGLIIEDAGPRRSLGERAAVADRHDVDFELLDARAVARRWPQFRLAGTEEALYQRRTGVVDAARADATHVALARGHGAEIREHSPVRALRPTAGHVEVVLDDEVIRAERVVVAAGAGTNEVLDGLVDPLPLTVRREQVTSFATPNLLDFSPARFPVFTWHGTDTVHGFPVDGEVVTKLGHEAATDARRRHEFLSAHVPGFLGPERHTRTRLATVPADQHHVVDTLPGEPRVSVGVGARDAFTFASLIGRILAELATTGASRRPIGSFALDRPALAAAA
ncbi:FAD-dependent oxidoreductase [Actinomycetospora rhizophila]|uniref:FAD-dependent oxidoreductase n=1 Tax=Actinomycetospora rhizophila TaxID=1416876 RepID=A0ABV9ZJ26_9PSEU